jgi:hypothetical protein
MDSASSFKQAHRACSGSLLARCRLPGRSRRPRDGRDGESNHAVLRVPAERTFTVAAGGEGLGDRLFVFGRQVDDFRVVDYEVLSVLDISATQELLRRLEVQERANENLSQRLSQLETMLAAASQR